MYEAAALDRASRWTTFWRITLPSLRRTMILVVMLQTAAQLQLFGQAQLLTARRARAARRGPMVLFIFETAFGRWELGYAAAAAEVLFLLILAVTLTQYWATTRRGSERRAWPPSASSRPAWSPPDLCSAIARSARGIMVAPLLWTLLLSLKDNAELVGNSGAAFSRALHARELRRDPGGQQVFRWLLNSLDRVARHDAGVLVLCSLAGYGFARLEFPFRRTLFVFVLLGLAIPEQAVILPQHQLFAELRPAQQLSGPDPAGPGRAVRRVLHDPIFPRHPARAGRGGDARRRLALHDLLEGAAAADPAGAGDARRVHLPRLVERLLVAADLGDPERHVHADRRPRLGADELCADQRPRLPDGAGGVRVDPDLHRLHRVPEADRPGDGRDGGRDEAPRSSSSRRSLAARRLRPRRRRAHRNLPAALLRRMRRRISAQRPTSSTAEGECGIITDADQPLQRREPRHPGQQSTSSPGPAIRSSPRRSPRAIRPTW